MVKAANGNLAAFIFYYCLLIVFEILVKSSISVDYNNNNKQDLFLKKTSNLGEVAYL